MRWPVAVVVTLLAGTALTAAAHAAPVRSLPLGEATHRVLDPTSVAEADLAASGAGDVALIWSSQNTMRIVTRAAGGAFQGPVALPGAFEAHTSNANRTLDGPVVGIGGGTLVTWRNGAGNLDADHAALQVAAADPGQAVRMRAPLTTLPALGESPRASWRTAVGPDGTASMAVVRGGAVLVTQRRPGSSFGPEAVVSVAGEQPDQTSLRMTQDDAGGVTATWTSRLPCTTVTAPGCLVNRVAARPAGGAFGVPRSLSEVPTGRMPGATTSYRTQLQQPFAQQDGAGRTILAWRRLDPGRLDAMEVSIGSAATGYSRAVALPGTASDQRPGCRTTPTLYGALPGRSGSVAILVGLVSGCGTAMVTYTVKANGAVGGPRRIVAGIGLRAAKLVRRGRRAALIVQSHGTIRAAFWQRVSFTRLTRIGLANVPRFGPSALMADGRLLVEYGAACGSAGRSGSQIGVLGPRSKAATIRRVNACGSPAPTILDATGALVTVTLRDTLDAFASCPIPAALAAQRAGRRAACR